MNGEMILVIIVQNAMKSYKMDKLKKEFVPYHLALRLKNLGFKDDCMAWYGRKNKIIVIHRDHISNTRFESIAYNTDYMCTAPLWQQAFDFLRENYQYNSLLVWDKHNNYWDVWIQSPLGKKDELLTNHPNYKTVRHNCLSLMLREIEAYLKS